MTVSTEFNPFDRSWWAEPYPLYRHLLDTAPTGRLPMFGVWYFTRYADCDAILRDGRFGVDERKSSIYDQFLRGSNPQREDEAVCSFLFLDPPDHTRLRSYVGRAFTPRVVEQLRSHIDARVRSLVDAFEEEPEVDLVAALALPLPVGVICDLLGIEEEDRSKFGEWSKHLVAALDPELFVPQERLDQRRGALEELRSYMAHLIAERRAGPGDDLVSSLATISSTDDAGVEHAPMSDDELISTLVLLLVAGYETTVNLIGNAILALARHPEQAHTLASQPGLLNPAIEEVLRYDPPVQLTSRVALADVTIGEAELKQGDLLLALIAAGNRDEARYERPDEFDISRGDPRHLSFSLGAHHCLGAPLARAEAQLAIGEVMRRFSGLELAGEPKYRETLVLRGIESLPVQLHRA